MALLIGLVVLACAVWVLFFHTRRGPQSSWWAVFVAVIWFIAFPFYLYKRK